MEQISPEETKITLKEYIAKNNINNIDFMGYSRDDFINNKLFGTGYPITKKEMALCYAMEFQAQENGAKQVADLNTQLFELKLVIYSIEFCEQVWKKLFDKAEKIEKITPFI